MYTKHVDDYIDKLAEAFPEVDKKSIKKIVNYGLNTMFYFIKTGNEIMLKKVYGDDQVMMRFYSPRLLNNDKKYTRERCSKKFALRNGRKKRGGPSKGFK